MITWFRAQAPLIVILLLALLLRLPLLDGSFWLDEAAQALESARPLSQQFNIRDDFQPPLLHLITFVALRVDTAEWWLRTWGALIPGLLSIVATYALGSVLYNRQTGLIAALLLATSSFHIFYSQELRPYALPTAWASISMFALVKWNNSNNKSYLAGFAASTLGGLYSSYLYPFLLFGQICWIAVTHRSKIWQFFGALTLVLIGYLPWVPIFVQQLTVGTQLRTLLPGWESVVSTPQLRTIPLVLAKFLFGVLNVELTFGFIAAALCITILVLYLGKTVWRRNPSSTQYVLYWLMLPLISAWIISFWVPVVQPKRVLFLLPALILLVSAAIHYGWKQKKIHARVAAAGLCILMLTLNLYGTARYYTDPTLQRENWRGLQQQIRRQYPAEKSVAVFSFPAPFAPWTWYDDGTFPTFSTGTLTARAHQDLPNALKTLADVEYILVFDYLRDLTDPNNDIPAGLESLGFVQRDSIDYPGIGFVRVFTRQATILSFTSL